MSLFTTRSLRRALSTVILLSIATATAQQCYFPDGTAALGHVACSSDSGVSSCCSSSSYCLDNGLCYGASLLSRGSCTDRSWESDECANYCTAVDRSTSVDILPCSSTKFTCGLNSSNCESDAATFTIEGGDSLVLRADQIASLTSQTTATSAASASDGKMYTGGDMAGLACGLCLPLLAGLVAALLALRKQKMKYGPPKLMYKLPDGHESFDPRSYRQSPPTPLSRSGSAMSLNPPPASPSIYGHPVSPVDHRFGSQNGNRPPHIANMLDRIDSKSKAREAGIELNPFIRHELDSAPPYIAAPEAPVIRHELANYRMST